MKIMIIITQFTSRFSCLDPSSWTEFEERKRWGSVLPLSREKEEKRKSRERERGV